MIHIENASEKQQQAITEAAHQLHLTDLHLTLNAFEQAGVHISGQGKSYTLTYGCEHLIYRGLLLIANNIVQGGGQLDVQEKTLYDDLGYMADASRNAVLNLSACKKMILHLALMGYSNFQLYMEDTYEIAGYEYFGYFRGRYTIAELQEIEAECHKFGMTFIPCIQTLAHLSAYFKWTLPQVQETRDLEDILLIDNPATYELIDGMFRTFAQLKTRKINIGMDEAFQVGLGRYLAENGYQNRALIMCQHLDKVLSIAEKYGFSCSMWSDMFFNLMAGGGVYAGDIRLNPDIEEALGRVRDRVKLIYWDYYQTDASIYLDKMKKHDLITDDLAFAGGAWKWIGFTPDNRFSMKIAEQAHQACQEHRITEVTVTGWGDNGGETAQFSILPSLLIWAELNLTNSKENLESHFRTLTQIDLPDFLQIDSANFPPSNNLMKHSVNPNRYTLYQDVLCPLLQEHILADEDARYYVEKSQVLIEIAKQTGEWSYLFETQSKLCRVLAQKAGISVDIRQAYKEEDKEKLATLAREALPSIKADFQAFRPVFSQQWQRENKIFGLDTIDIRFGGLEARIDRAISRLTDYLNGTVNQLEELEVELLPYNNYYQAENGIATSANQWHLLATASTIYTT